MKRLVRKAQLIINNSKIIKNICNILNTKTASENIKGNMVNLNLNTNLMLNIDTRNNNIFLSNKNKSVKVSIASKDMKNFINKLEYCPLDKEILKDNKIAMALKPIMAEHDVMNRDKAVCYINKQVILEGGTHAVCIQEYIDKYGNEEELAEQYYRPNINDKSDEDHETLSENITSIGFAHLVEDEKAVYIELGTMINLTEEEFVQAIKNEYPGYSIYDDYSEEVLYKTANIKDLRKKVITSNLVDKRKKVKISNLIDNRKKVKAGYSNRDFAIAIVNGKVYSADTHGEAITEFLKDMGISDDMEFYDRDEMNEVFGPNFTYQFAFAHAIKDNIIIEENTLQNISLDQAAKLIKETFPEYSIVGENDNKVLAGFFHNRIFKNILSKIKK